MELTINRDQLIAAQDAIDDYRENIENFDSDLRDKLPDLSAAQVALSHLWMGATLKLEKE